MKNTLALLVCCPLLLSTTACQREAAGHQSVVVATQLEAAAEEEPAAQVDEPGPAVRLDPAQLAGFFGIGNKTIDLKSADNGAKVFEFKANGRYVFTGGVVYESVEGHWALEKDRTRLRLTPDQIQPESGELLFAITSSDTLRLLNADGTPTNVSFDLVRLKH